MQNAGQGVRVCPILPRSPADGRTEEWKAVARLAIVNLIANAVRLVSAASAKLGCTSRPAASVALDGARRWAAEQLDVGLLCRAGFCVNAGWR